MIGEKKKFLALYDYQTGGVWVFIYARSEEEILKAYPELQIMDEQRNAHNLYPPGANVIEKLQYDKKSTYDIDEEPRDFLLALIEGRKAK